MLEDGASKVMSLLSVSAPRPVSATDGPAYAAIVVAMTATGVQTPLSIVSPSPCRS